MAILEVHNIEKHFGETRVLEDISFSLEQGQALAIIGSSGSGKTTLLRCLNFLETPDQGRIVVQGDTLFDAADKSTQNEEEIRKKRLRFGMVFQSFNLFPQYTALQNVTLAPRLLAKERPDFKEKKKEIFDAIERHGKELVPTSKGIQLVGLAPEDLRSAELTARWEDRLARIAKGQERDFKFVEEMRVYATDLVNAVKASDATYTHDNQTRKPCPECGKNLLLVHGKRGDMLVCPDRECGFRKSVMQTTNARCPNCHKKLELWGEGDKQTFACACGYREKLPDFQARRKADGAGKSEVRRYMAQQEQKKDEGNTAMADALAKWMANKDKNKK